MRIALVTDAWQPQVNGVVTTLVELVSGLRAAGHEVLLIEPSAFRRVPCPGYPGLEMAWRPGREVARRLDEAAPDAIHIATEGPLGWAARRHCRRRGWRFSTAFHTRFPEILAGALHLPVSWGYALFRHFHAASDSVMVPTEGMLRILQRHGFERLQRWDHGVDLSLFRPQPRMDLGLPRPVWLHVGRLSWEKNLQAFLDLDLPGTKLVYGEGPLAESLQARYPQVVWRGVVARETLPRLYASADAFVFPGRSETFGLVMLESLACGTPVAAYPVAGPLDVLGDSGAGVMDEDLRAAALRALDVPRAVARAHAERRGWPAVTQRFLELLVPAMAPPRHGAVTVPS
jgi:glycosyltransferase involved in cell wall biosynthesis